MSASIHVSISAEPVFQAGPLVVSNSIITSVIVSSLIILGAAYLRTQIKDAKSPATAGQNFAEWLVESLYNLVNSVTNNHAKSLFFMPLISTFFIFILFNNWFGLLPGVGTIGFIEGESKDHVSFSPLIESAKAVTTESHPTETTTKVDVQTDNQGEESKQDEAESHQGPKFVPYLRAGTADLNTTLALALISIISTQLIGIKYLKLHYFKKFINFSSPIAFFVGVLETISEFAKIISFAFRLFGNIFAGEVLLAVISALTFVVIPMPFYGMEIFVGFIQALVFAMLSLVFFNMATESHDSH